MAQETPDKLALYVEPASTSRGPGGSVLKHLDVEVFADEMAGFVGALDAVLKRGAAAVSSVELTEIEVAAKIGAEGKLGLLGSGASASGEASIKFRFDVRKQQSS